MTFRSKISSILLLIFCCINSYAGTSDGGDCTYFKYCGSNSNTSSAQKSSPSVSSGSRSNPSIVAKIKGFGLETLYQQNNPVEFSIVSGNGRFGTLVSSSSGENSFFGNRTPELEDEFLNRSLGKKRYKNKKYQFGTGLSLIDKKNFELIVGGSTIYNMDTKNFNFGYSGSVRIFIFNASAFVYKDDYKFDYTSHYCYSCASNYSTYYGVSNFSETFSVRALAFGVKLGNLSVDYAQLQTKYKFYSNTTSISILSSAYLMDRFLFNAAFRNEISDNPIITNSQITYSPIKAQTYYGVQYLPNKHLSLGVGYNNYLLKEISFTLTMFL